MDYERRDAMLDVVRRRYGRTDVTDVAWVLTDALATYWREKYGAGDVAADPRNPTNIEAGQALARILNDRLAHLDALAAALEGLPYVRMFVDKEHIERAAVLAIIRGEQ